MFGYPHLMIKMKENLDLYSVLVMSMTSSTLVLICTKFLQILTSSMNLTPI